MPEADIKQDGTCPLSLSMQDIVKRFGSLTALDRVNLEAGAGEIHALLGENGAGKSTLMHILSGLTRPDSGTITIHGKETRVSSPRAARALGIAMVHQHFTLVPAFTVEQNLALDAPSHPFRPNYQASRAASHALERAEGLGWKLPAAALVSELPVGVQQRVEIVKALATNADILIFDEPTAVLAGEEVEELFRVLRSLRNEGKTVLLIAHKLAEIMAVADKVTVLRRGNKVADASVAETNREQLALWMVGEIPARSESRNGIEKDMPPQPVLFEANNISVKGDRGEIIIKALSLKVHAGEILGIGGVDGNGQTELAEAVVGLRPLLEGDLIWKSGKFQPGLSPASGYIPQDRRRTGLAPTMSIEENLLFEAVQSPLYRRGPFLKRTALKALAQSLITRYDIRTTDTSLPASSLSGGNQQKIVAARALHSEPDWIVAVNPTRGLDINATRFVHEQLRKARARGAALLLISTDLDELAALADRAAILSSGQLKETSFENQSAAQLGLLLGGAARP